MERKEFEIMYDMDEVEFEILNVLYFVEPFEKILEEVPYAANIVADVLKTLIHKKWVVAMKWDEVLQDYKRSFIYDSDNMHAYSYLATKEGLLAHNGS
ncbi:MAG: hypothetical protein LW669_03270 [Sphingobacteriales bacterium]|jgi:hypothetical protein|nr:hypothetical protein [Sphingobacteriales bacterium]